MTLAGPAGGLTVDYSPQSLATHRSTTGRWRTTAFRSSELPSWSSHPNSAGRPVGNLGAGCRKVLSFSPTARGKQLGLSRHWLDSRSMARSELLPATQPKISLTGSFPHPEFPLPTQSDWSPRPKRGCSQCEVIYRPGITKQPIAGYPAPLSSVKPPTCRVAFQISGVRQTKGLETSLTSPIYTLYCTLFGIDY